MKRIAAVFGLAVLVAGCGEPKIDGASEGALKESIQAIANKLPEDQRETFKDAVKTVAFDGLDLRDMMRDGGSEKYLANVRERIHGKTAAEVMAMADKIRAEREAAERQQALSEIAELEARKAAAEAAAAQLQAFVVERSRFYKRPQRYGGDEPIIELTVRNGTEHAISRAYFVGTIASPGRSVPWLVERFNYKIPGGLEPGETASWSLAPNMFSDWGNVSAPEDALFTVRVERLDGADGKALFGGATWTERDEERLSQLKAKYPQ